MFKELFLTLVCLVSCAVNATAQDIFLLGEIHDNPAHHGIQAQWIGRIAPSAVVFEMLTPQQAQAVMDLPDRGADDIRDVTQWDQSGWPSFEIYAPVFDAVGNRPIIGAGVPRDDMRAVMAQGVVASFGAQQAARFGLDQPLDADQQALREQAQLLAHCNAMPGEMLPVMVDLQRYRDAVLARAAVAALDLYGAPVAVITGNGHARTDWGVPVYIAAARPDLDVFALGLREEGTADFGQFDQTLTTQPMARPDPCASFASGG